MVSTGFLLASAFAALAFGYLCGSIPFGVILTRRRHARPRTSVRTSCDNVLRTGRTPRATLSDMLKVLPPY
jgi:glycerol-3-phosphate acyltransferase PlsY